MHACIRATTLGHILLRECALYHRGPTRQRTCYKNRIDTDRKRDNRKLLWTAAPAHRAITTPPRKFNSERTCRGRQTTGDFTGDNWRLNWSSPFPAMIQNAQVLANQWHAISSSAPRVMCTGEGDFRVMLYLYLGVLWEHFAKTVFSVEITV